MKRPVWTMALSEFVGTALLIGVGCSFVVLTVAPGSPVVHAIPSAGLRRALTGFLFGTTGGLVALSYVGKLSGAHINPVVTLAFWAQRKISGTYAMAYVLAQLLGAVAGASLLILWGPWSASVHDAATVPGSGGTWLALLGETGATFCLVVALFLVLAHRSWRNYAPGLFPILYALMVLFEAPISGTSTNPARSFGPALISHLWAGWWVYGLGPLLGTLLGLVVLKWLLPVLEWEIQVAKLHHFRHDPFRVFSPTPPSPHPDTIEL